MACLGADGEGLPFPDELVRFAWRHRQHGEIERGDALHGEDFEGAEGEAVLLAIATVAIDHGDHRSGIGLALTGESRHRDYDAGRYTQRE